MTDKLSTQHQTTFDSIRQFDAEGNEFWLARSLAKTVDYSQYRHFLPVLERAREACHNSGQNVADHMEDILTMVKPTSPSRRVDKSLPTLENLTSLVKTKNVWPFAMNWLSIINT